MYVMANDLLTKDLITYDPLTATTRKERTTLLGLSILGIALVEVPLVPEKLAFLGIEFAKVQQDTLVKIYALVIFYYLVAFAIYAFTDYVAWRRKEVISYKEYTHQNNERKAQAKAEIDEPLGPKIVIEEAVHKRSWSFEDTSPEALMYLLQKKDKDELSYSGFASYWLAFWAARIRAVFEFILPIGLALVTLVILLSSNH